MREKIGDGEKIKKDQSKRGRKNKEEKSADFVFKIREKRKSRREKGKKKRELK